MKGLGSRATGDRTVLELAFHWHRFPSADYDRNGGPLPHKTDNQGMYWDSKMLKKKRRIVKKKSGYKRARAWQGWGWLGKEWGKHFEHIGNEMLLFQWCCP